MIHWIQPPQSAYIAKYIECYWLIEKDSNSETYQFPKLNPDPSAHLIISPADQAYCYRLNSTFITGQGSHWLYPHQQTFELDHSNPFVHLGVKFHIGALYSLSDLSKRPLELDNIETIKASGRLKQLGFNESTLIELARQKPIQCVEQLDALFAPWFKESHEDQHSKITRAALAYLDEIIISDLGKQLHCSQRTIERSFQKVTGLTLKQCQSMKRLEAMLEYLYQRESSDLHWTEIALKFGFSDQPHLIRYLKKQLGFTPKTYEKERGLTIDTYGGVNSISN
ncbi:AraC family transcriptional regulator [Vibrio sp. SS-MA-C1-2]|uniref:helix-turn-helix domain-containing protein n=1 Tax=Vibrio sp. SS-MA-C1-2 TaxID=2908646 RepID=UPI001F2E43FE|nr:AraC family transcriptional regulator [Vibrio sp. SS-MA-C1-2]UJF17637.1 AraC family transcriptional regulator [Vibrio sp. SS-MA-C1-2]